MVVASRPAFRWTGSAASRRAATDPSRRRQNARLHGGATATTSSGFTPRCGSRRKLFHELLNPACGSGADQHDFVDLVSGNALHRNRLLARPRERSQSSTTAPAWRASACRTRCLGRASAVMNGKLISVSTVVESSILVSARLSALQGHFVAFEGQVEAVLLLELGDEPFPRCVVEVVAAQVVSPLVDFTRSRPRPLQESKCRVPRSLKSGWFYPSSCRARSQAAAVGSLTMRFTSRRQSCPRPWWPGAARR